jgi:hypothetical protein
MLGEYPESLEIEQEIVGCPLGPEIAVPFARHGVIAAIHFDDVELAGIVLKAGFR